MDYFQVVFLKSVLICFGTAPEVPYTESIEIDLSKREVGDRFIVENTSDIKVINGVTYFQEEPYTGWIHDYSSDNKLLRKTGFYQGLQQDTLYKYHPNGAIAEKRLYHMGKKHGKHVGWYPDGSVSFQYEFVHGLTEGEQKKWRSSGALAFVRNYSKGKMMGLQQGWLANGEIRSNYFIKPNGKKYGLLGVNNCVSVEEY